MRHLKNYLPKKDALKFVAMIVAMVLLSSSPSTAQEFSGVTNFLDGVVEGITGPFGVAISAIAVIAIGFSFMTGHMNWTFAVSIIIGIAIVFGGATFVKGIAPS
ncbi:TrbC/VirB2 family protein (plasmid) [Rhizobium sp. CB3171]|uniref:TrbC/VirB2 family protein n=1 Tax=Rhizobium sp. CB3171 TaxID=3039157 RepID=UPI0024B03E5B|nr:TrbC/VirB2 family protein [Rhizobium sp. CB3171]WFU07287.1 TrbC/VirB2 family protein [Rhizobium sp. CB3171]